MSEPKRYSIRLKPTPSQEKLLWQYAGARRFAWNWALNKLDEWYKAGEKQDWNRLGREFTLLRRELEWLGALNLKNTRSAFYDLKKTFSRFFAACKRGEKAGFPRFKSRHDSKQGFFVPENTELVGKRVKVPGIGALKMMRPLPPGQVGKATRIKHVAGKWYASFTVTNETEPPTPVEPNNLVGIDEGLNKYLTISDGVTYENPRFLRQYARKLKHWQRKLARQKKGSKRRNATKRRIAKVHAAIANRRKHYSHLVSRRVADSYDAVCVESHSLKALGRSRLAKSMLDAGQGHYRDCLEYKMADRGKQMLKADPYFPSSKTCHVCGHKMDAMPLNIRKWTCPGCNSTHDRDLNAAKMLEQEGRRQLTASLV